MSDYVTFFLIIALNGLKPGPGIMFYTSLVTSEGLKSALITAAGTDSGHFLIIAFLVIGVNFMSSYPVVVDGVQIGACLYLMYMGVRNILSEYHPSVERAKLKGSAFFKYSRGFLWAFSNPVNAAVYSAMLPLMAAQGEHGGLFAAFVMGAITALTYTVTRLPYLLFAYKARTLLKTPVVQQNLKRISGCFFLALSSFMLLRFFAFI